MRMNHTDLPKAAEGRLAVERQPIMPAAGDGIKGAKVNKISTLGEIGDGVTQGADLIDLSAFDAIAGGGHDRLALNG